MKRIYENKLMVSFIMLGFCKPIFLQYYSNLQMLDLFYDLYKILVILIIFGVCIVSCGLRFRVIKAYSYILLLGLWQLGVTIFFGGAIERAFIDCITIFSIFVFITFGLKYSSGLFINQIKKIILFLLFLQLMSEITFPNGIPADLYAQNSANRLFFLTLDNGIVGINILGVTLIHLNKLINGCDIQKYSILDLSICLLTSLFSGSTTAIVCVLFMIMIPKWLELMNNSVFDKPTFWIICYSILFIFIILGGENSMLSILIGKVTGKKGFTGRTFLWSQAISYILKSPIIGYGRQITNYIPAWGGFFSSHNVVLEAALQGGVIEAYFWIMSIYWSAIRAKQVSSKYISRILLSALFIILISMMMEISVFSIYLFVLLGFLYSSNHLEVRHEIFRSRKVYKY